MKEIKLKSGLVDPKIRVIAAYAAEIRSSLNDDPIDYIEEAVLRLELSITEEEFDLIKNQIENRGVKV